MEESDFLLDLREVVLLGFQQYVSRDAVQGVIRGIRARDDFPAVIVEQCGARTYRIATVAVQGTQELDGGHHRAVGHYLERRPLKCRLPASGDCNVVWLPPPTYHDIRKIMVRADSVGVRDGLTEYQRRKLLFRRYR